MSLKPGKYTVDGKVLEVTCIGDDRNPSLTEITVDGKKFTFGNAGQFVETAPASQPKKQQPITKIPASPQDFDDADA